MALLDISDLSSCQTFVHGFSRRLSSGANRHRCGGTSQPTARLIRQRQFRHVLVAGCGGTSQPTARLMARDSGA